MLDIQPLFVVSSPFLGLPFVSLSIMFRGTGLLVIEKDVSLELMKATISAIEIYGVCRCDKEIKQYYGL